MNRIAVGLLVYAALSLMGLGTLLSDAYGRLSLRLGALLP